MPVVKNRSDGSGTRLLELDSNLNLVPDEIADNCFVSYFEDANGRQWVFCGDNISRGTQDRNGLWSAKIFVDSELQKVSWECPCPNIPMDKMTQVWLISCWMSFTNNDCYQQVVSQLNKHVLKLIGN